MPTAKAKPTDVTVELAMQLVEHLQQERIIPRFVDSYVIEHGRQSLQVHATKYRELLALMNREALLALSVRALHLATMEPPVVGKSKPKPMTRKDAATFRRKFLSAMTRRLNWNAGDALDFQADLQMYEDLLARSTNTRRRKPFEAAHHPFVDRCAFVLDSPFLEKARLAATRALGDLDDLAEKITPEVMLSASK